MLQQWQQWHVFEVAATMLVLPTKIYPGVKWTRYLQTYSNKANSPTYVLDVKKSCKLEPHLKKLRKWGAPCISFFHQNCMIYVGGHAPNTDHA